MKDYNISVQEGRISRGSINAKALVVVGVRSYIEVTNWLNIDYHLFLQQENAAPYISWLRPVT